MKRLLEILADRESGASEIERRLSKGWLEVRPQDPATALGCVTDVVLERFPAMANLMAWVDAMWRLVEAGDLAQEDRLCSWLERRLEEVERAPIDIGRRLAPLLADRPIVFTLSRSGTLLGALATARLAGAAPDVRIAESRPESEGLLMAADLIAQGIETTALPDFSLISLLAGFRPRGLGLAAAADESMLLVGTDGITSSHFVNKVGTNALARAARDAGIPLIVAAGHEKLLPDRLVPASEIGAEPWNSGQSGLPGRRFDFERVANRLVERFILPDGDLTPEALAARIAQHHPSRHLTARLADIE